MSNMEDAIAGLEKLREELIASHKSFDVLEDQFMQASKLLTEACMKNKSLWEQACLWKDELAKAKAEIAILKGSK